MLKILNISKVCCIIQRLNSYNLMAKSVSKKKQWATYRPGEKR